MEKELKKVTFEFEDGTKKVLIGSALDDWEAICSMHSDYLLPGDADHVLASSYGGFVPAAVISGPERRSEMSMQIERDGGNSYRISIGVGKLFMARSLQEVGYALTHYFRDGLPAYEDPYNYQRHVDHSKVCDCCPLCRS